MSEDLRQRLLDLLTAEEKSAADREAKLKVLEDLLYLEDPNHTRRVATSYASGFSDGFKGGFELGYRHGFIMGQAVAHDPDSFTQPLVDDGGEGDE
ncbi:MAG: hypothetical protein QW688_08330 [Thermoprotei archaeon]